MLDQIPNPEVNSDDMAADCLAGVEQRVLYPMRFFAKQIDGRMDDANTGWEGPRLVGDFWQQDTSSH